MKKVVSLALALVLAFSCMTMAFAATEYECPYCRDAQVTAADGGAIRFVTYDAYKAHLKTCPNYSANYVDMSISEILTYLLEIVKLDNARATVLESIVEKIVGYVNDFITGLADKEGVAGAVEDLEAKLGEYKIDLGSGKIKDILDTLKAKIKALYCGEPATTAAAPVDSGSSATAGIAVFAAVSVAAAAAYVCTRKKDEE